MTPDKLSQDYARLRQELETLLAAPDKDMRRVDDIVHQLEAVQLAIKAEHGVIGNNPNE